jgi:ubiquinone/menaquinone biosynthesis C-methylase UbiE
MRDFEAKADAFYDALKPAIFKEIRLGVDDGERILDIGCGDCKLAEYLAENEHIEITGIDTNETKLPGGGRRQYKKFKGKLHCVKCNAGEMKRFSRESFSAVVSVYSLHEFSDVSLVLDECMRVLRKNGKIMAVDFLCGTLAGRAWDEEYYTRVQLRKMLGKAGFRIAGEKEFSEEGPLMIMGFKNV